MNNMNSIKKCRVCGDRANGFNYDALSCESCKVFFFRNSTKFEDLSCKQNENCEITLLNRSNCAKCRLKKCFAIGMKRTPVKNEQNHNRNHNKFDQILEICLLKQLSDFELKTMKKYVSNEVDLIQTLNRPTLSSELSKYELSCIADVRKAFVLKSENSTRVAKYASHISEMWDFPQLYIRRTIMFCHNFSVFNSLANEQQLLLLKPFCLNLLSVWFTLQAQNNYEGLFIFTDESECDSVFVPKELAVEFKNQKLVKKFVRFTELLYGALENDNTIRDLVFALLLFKPHENGYYNENIRYNYHLYSMLLRRYLQHKHQSRRVGNLRYGSLMRLIDRLDAIQQLKRTLVMEFGIDNVPLIIKELFSLV